MRCQLSFSAVSATILFACLLSFSLPLPAQPKAAQADSLEIAQRYDMRRRINGKYAGLFYGNATSYWRFGPESEDGTVSVSARTYLMEESIRNLEKSEKTLRSEMKSSFLLDSAWAVSEHSGDPAPLSRGFPSLPAANAVPGDAWEAPGLLIVDPKAAGSWTKIKTMIGYELKGKTRYDGKDALDLRARFAIRYKPGQDPDGDPTLQSAEGTREAWIYLDAESLQPLFIREKVSGELFKYSDGTSVQNDGFILSFFSGGAGRSAARESNKQKLERRLEGDDKLALREDERGLSLTIKDLRFVADSPELLPGEEERLLGIANALKALPIAQAFLVVGHTADFGTAESQLLLSLERARRVTAALAARGIDPGRFIVDGKGGTQAIADNSTEDGKALNRRVEIILLD
jgi:OmpA-OmpF porin, OOP family